MCSVRDELTKKSKEAPEPKSTQWSDLMEQYRPFLELLQITNDVFQEQAFAFYETGEYDLITNNTLGLATLMETVSPKQLSIILKSADINDEAIVKNYKDVL